MKPRSTVAALLAVTESLLAARAKAAQAKQAPTSRIAPRPSKLAKFLTGNRPLMRIKMQAFS